MVNFLLEKVKTLRMSCHVVVPPPSFLPRKGAQKANSVSPNKVSTVLTNLQRRNVQTLKVDASFELSIFQMAAQGELLQLQARLDTPGTNVDERDPQVRLILVTHANVIMVVH